MQQLGMCHRSVASVGCSSADDDRRGTTAAEWEQAQGLIAVEEAADQ